MARDEVEALFAGYAAAFARGDVEAVCARWAFPALFAARGKRAALDAAAFRANTEKLCLFYAARGVAKAEKRLLGLDALDGTLALARTADRLSDGEGRTVAEWEHLYLLQQTEAGIRIVMAMPEGELAAWERLGTPLGSW